MPNWNGICQASYVLELPKALGFVYLHPIPLIDVRSAQNIQLPWRVRVFSRVQECSKHIHEVKNSARFLPRSLTVETVHDESLVAPIERASNEVIHHPASRIQTGRGCPSTVELDHKTR